MIGVSVTCEITCTFLFCVLLLITEGGDEADYTVMGMEFAANLLLISRASSDAYEPYVFLKGHSEKSSNPDGQNDLL